MRELFKRLQSLESKATENTDCPVVTVSSYSSDEDIQSIKVDVTYFDSIGDVTDRRHFVTTFSRNDIPSITEKKMDILEEYLKQAKCVRTMISDLAETEE